LDDFGVEHWATARRAPFRALGGANSQQGATGLGPSLVVRKPWVLISKYGASWGFSCNISLYPRMTKVGAWPGSNRTANGHFPIPMSGGLLRTASTGSSGFQNTG